MFSPSLSFVATLVFSLALSGLIQATPHPHRASFSAKHRRPAANITSQDINVQKRGETFQGQFTNFVTGLGACGQTNVASDYIVALNVPQYAGGAHCGETITITINGKTVQAQVADECMKCAFGSVDMTDGLFEHFAPLDTGVLQGSWFFGTEQETAPPKTSSSTHSDPPPPTTTSTHTSTSHKTTSTTSSTPTSTSTSSEVTTSKTSSTSSFTPTSTSSSSSSVPTPTPTPSVEVLSGVLSELNQAFIGLSILAVAGKQ
ncbi:hypothetical protein ABKN59_003820 [Abortiporus biennis]